MSELAAAFIKAKRAFGPALKDKNNPAFRSKYADLGACIDAVESALLDNGLAFIQETSEDATGVTVETVFLHESGQERRCGKLHVPAAKQDPQGYGSALTYARRYSLMAACGIAPEDDDGNAAVKAKDRGLEPLLEASIEQAKQKRAGVMGAVLENVHLEPSVRNALNKLHVAVQREFVNSPRAAFDLIEEQGLNQEERIFLWSLLPSNIRSGLKAEGKAREAVPQ